MRYQFKPSLLGFLILLCCVALFIRLGTWQYNKAQQKITFQTQLDTSLYAPPVDLPLQIQALEQLRYKQVKFSGSYDIQHQIYLDNQVNNGVAGFHVITPVKLKNNSSYVLVNRGWIAANSQHDDLPNVETSELEQTFVGQIWLPSQKFFTLDKPLTATKSSLQRVWQNMDIAAYQANVNFKVLPYVVKLNADSPAQGFARNWPRPDDRSTMHLGYAYQWFGFAFAACLIYFFVSFKKKVVE